MIKRIIVLFNLQLLTQKENCKKSAKNRDYKFITEIKNNKKCVKATNIETNEVSYFNSMYAVYQHLGINFGIVKMVCEGLNRCKSGISKKDGKSYKFEYVKNEDVPDNYKKSYNLRKDRVAEEDKKKTPYASFEKMAKQRIQMFKMRKNLQK